MEPHFVVVATDTAKLWRHALTTMNVAISTNPFNLALISCRWIEVHITWDSAMHYWAVIL
jgi:hypothetical protein